MNRIYFAALTAAATLSVLAEALALAALIGDAIASLRIYHFGLSFGIGDVPYNRSP